MEIVRYGVIGVGGIGRRHIESIKKTRNAELVAVADINESMVKKVGEKFKVQWYVDYEKMLEKEELDAVTVCTPHGLHAPMTITALKEGKHVLCEKPIANHVKEADEMISVAKKQGLKLGVVADGVVLPAIRKIKESLKKGDFGEVYWASVIWGGTRTKAYYSRGAWRGTWRLEGGACMINQAIHMIDLLPFFLGRPKEVFGRIAKKCHNFIEAEDMATALVLFEKDVPATIQCHNLETPPIDEITLLTEWGKIVNHWIGPTTITKYKESMRDYTNTMDLSHRLEFETIEWEPFKEGFEGIHPINIAAFTDAIIQDEDPIFTAEAARTTLEIVNAITLSHFKKSKVTLPLDRDEYVKLFEKLVKGEIKL